MSEPEVVWDVDAELGEGPCWIARDKAVWFVDIKGRRLYRYGVEDKSKRSWPAPDQIGFALPAQDGSLVCGVRGGLYRFDPRTEHFSLIVAVEEDRPQNRLNDGFVAPDGSLWFGSMDDSESGISGALYRWTGGAPVQKEDGYGITNGPAMSPDGRTLYHNSTLEKIVYAFDHKDGAVSNRRVFATVAEGYCDGPSVDSAGVVHVGLFGGWGVDRYAPDGRRLVKIRFPCSAVTIAAFGGADLRGLYCTTAWKGQNAETRKTQPFAGALFRVRVDTPGLPQNLIKL